MLMTLFLHAKLDSILWGTKLTPGVLLILGYTIISCIYFFLYFFYDVRNINFTTYLLLMFFAFLSMVISALIRGFFSWKNRVFYKTIITSNSKIRVILLLATLAYTLLAIPLAINNGGLWSSESKEVLSAGIVGHLHVLLSYLLVYYAIKNSDNWPIKILLYFLAIIAIGINPTKSWLFIPVFAVFLAENLKRRNAIFGVYSFLILGLIGIIFFLGIYLSRQLNDGDSFDMLLVQLEWIVGHLIFYLTAGFFGLNEILNGLDLRGGIETLFAPLFNIYAFIRGEKYINIISNEFVYGFTDTVSKTNVYTFLGTLIGYGGFYIGLFLGLLFIGITYFLFAVSWKLNSFALKAGSLYLTSAIAFGWYDYYFYHLKIYEIIVMSVFSFIMQRITRYSMKGF